MKFLPFENITYHTQLSVEEVINRLSENLESRKYFFPGLKSKRKAYEGYIKHNTFNINKVLDRRNGFVPIIKGKLYENNTGTIIKVKMRLHEIALIFGIFLFTILLPISVANIAYLLLSKAAPTRELIMPIFMFILFSSMIMYHFKSVSVPTKKHLAKLFEAKIKTS